MNQIELFCNNEKNKVFSLQGTRAQQNWLTGQFENEMTYEATKLILHRHMMTYQRFTNIKIIVYV